MSAPAAELVFAVDVSSFTKSGFIGSTSYGGNPLDVSFDDGDKGVYLTAEMASRLHVRKGSKLAVVVEVDRRVSTNVTMGGVSKTTRISDAKVYYAAGKEGGAIIRISKA